MKKGTKPKKTLAKDPGIAPDRIFNESPEKIAKTVRLHRKKLDLTQKQAADRCGVKRASLGALEEGRLANVSDKKIWKVCKGLKIDPPTLSRDMNLKGEANKKLDELIQSMGIDHDASTVLLKLFEKALNPDAAPAGTSQGQAAKTDEDILGRFGEWALATAPMGRIIIRSGTGESVEVTKEKMRTIHELDIPITLYNRLKELQSQGYIKSEPYPISDRTRMAAETRAHYRTGATGSAAQKEFRSLCEGVGKTVENPHALRMSYYNDFKAAARKTGGSDEAGDLTVFETPIKEMDPDDYALVNVVGDSMAPLICEGDKVLIERIDEPPRDGTIVLVNYDGGMIKRFYKSGDTITLRSENPEYSDIEISAGEAGEKGFRVAGRVRNIWRDL